MFRVLILHLTGQQFEDSLTVTLGTSFLVKCQVLMKCKTDKKKLPSQCILIFSTQMPLGINKEQTVAIFSLIWKSLDGLISILLLITMPSLKACFTCHGQGHSEYPRERHQLGICIPMFINWVSWRVLSKIKALKVGWEYC